MKKVTHLTSVHNPSDVRIFVKECRTLANAGYQVVLVAAGGEERVVDGVQIRTVPKPKRRLERMTKTAWMVYRVALREKSDVYHFHDPELIPVSLLLRFRGHRVVYDIHEDVPRQVLSKHYLPTRLRKIVGGAVEILESFAARRFSALVTATPHISSRFEYLNTRVIIVQNFPLSNELAVGASEVPWEQRERVVVYVGGMTAPRGIREMVTAFGLLPKDCEVELHLAGIYAPSRLRDEMKQLPGWERVRELGFLDRRGIREALGTARAGLALIHPEPRYQVAWPVKMFEYMAAGIPVIASDFPLWREIVEGAGCGVVVDPLNPRAIADAVQYLLDHPKEAEEMGRNGRRSVEDRYNWGSEERKLLALYEELLSSTPSRSDSRVVKD
jgi:glycosyltransferase involved in cell wall biosynthesis